MNEIFQLAEQLIQHLSKVEEEAEELLAEQEDAIVIPDSDFEPIQLHEKKIKYRTFNGHSLVVNEDGVVEYPQSENRKDTCIIPQIPTACGTHGIEPAIQLSLSYFFLSHIIYFRPENTFCLLSCIDASHINENIISTEISYLENWREDILSFKKLTALLRN